jgi:preprotein translocase subunit SecG
MTIILVVLHIIVCVALIMIVLLQTGKGADLGAAFGGGSSQTLFGSTGATTFLHKMTTAAAIIFMLTSLALAYIVSHRTKGESIMTDAPPPIEQKADTQTSPAQPETTAPAPASGESDAQPAPKSE